MPSRPNPVSSFTNQILGLCFIGHHVPLQNTANAQKKKKKWWDYVLSCWIYWGQAVCDIHKRGADEKSSGCDDGSVWTQLMTGQRTNRYLTLSPPTTGGPHSWRQYNHLTRDTTLWEKPNWNLLSWIHSDYHVPTGGNTLVIKTLW